MDSKPKSTQKDSNAIILLDKKKKKKKEKEQEAPDQDDLYSLMWSSRNLGQGETSQEKRRREVQFSRAGLDVPHRDRPVKKRTADNLSGDGLHDSEEMQSSPVVNGNLLLSQALSYACHPCSGWALPIEQVGTKTVQNASLSNISNSANCLPQRALTTPTVVHVSRPKEVESNRSDLPIVMMEQEIMEPINDNT
ncbi:hypothetical protein RND71_001073 [Anisodus tanguticus]|uniref:Uncharacterized protein n=1 Tax=Anisodus tanguticus TaxID=243964 RepID=A0AAE1VVL3_9SOLA|nr:hypothetical protein RND71_001073 [Anisodus tanguticus]